MLETAKEKKTLSANVVVLLAAIITGGCSIFSYNLGQSNIEKEIYEHNKELIAEVINLENDYEQLNESYIIMSRQYEALFNESQELREQLGMPPADRPTTLDHELLQTTAVPILFVVSAYESDNRYKEYTGTSEDIYFVMAGEKYNYGFVWANSADASYSIYNLGGKYKTIRGMLDHIDGSSMRETTIAIIYDNVLAEEIVVSGTMIPYEKEFDVTGVSQLRIVVRDYQFDRNGHFGFANVTIE